MTLPKFAYFTGHIVPYEQAKIGVLNHTFNYGTGVFGGLRAYWNEQDRQLYLYRPLDHFRRFLDSARLLCMNLPHTPQQLTDITVELLRSEARREDSYVRPLAYVPDETVGVRLHDLHADVTIVSIPFGRYIESEEGSSVTFSSWRRIDDNSIPARGKIIGAYVNSAFIKTDAMRAGYDEAIVLNADGHISEGSAENFFMVRGGLLVTRRNHPPHRYPAGAGGTRNDGCRTADRPHRGLPGGGSVLLRNRRPDLRHYPRR
jgi:branched-chain amino acid aminotransferase